jgi:hypothetical protein
MANRPQNPIYLIKVKFKSKEASYSIINKKISTKAAIVFINTVAT